VNASLWTISVELQFYLLIPVLYSVFFRRRQETRYARIAFLLLGAGSLLVYTGMDREMTAVGKFHDLPLTLKLLHNSFVPHLWMFMLGIGLHRRFDIVQGWIRDRALAYISAYAIVAYFIDRLAPTGFVAESVAILVERSLLALAVISSAYTMPGLSSRLLRGQDLSYGIYVYHFLVINILVELGLITSLWSILLVFCITLVAAFASWRFVEKPSLALKDRRAHRPPAADARTEPLPSE
jgi:peptidoglycan/LPS O-acetylase OafA/YrhL